MVVSEEEKEATKGKIDSDKLCEETEPHGWGLLILQIPFPYPYPYLYILHPFLRAPAFINAR